MAGQEQSRPHPTRAQSNKDTDSNGDDFDKLGPSNKGGSAQDTYAKAKRKEAQCTPDKLTGEGEPDKTQLTTEQTLVEDLPDKQIAEHSGTTSREPQGSVDQTGVPLPEELLDYDPGQAYTLSPFSTINTAPAEELFPLLYGLVE